MKLSFSLSLLAVSLGLVTATSEQYAQHGIQARGPMRHHHSHLMQARNEDGTLKKMYKRKTCKAKSSSSKSSSGSGSGSGSGSSGSSSSSKAASATKAVKQAQAQQDDASSSSSTSSSAKAQQTKDSSSSNKSDSSSSSGSGSGSGIVAAVKDLVGILRDGQGTFFTPDTGACGWPNTDSDYIVAISHTLYDQYTKNGNPNDNSLCGRQIKATYQGKSVEATIADRCTGCNTWDLDFTPTAFSQLAAESVGRMDIQWEFTGK